MLMNNEHQKLYNFVILGVDGIVFSIGPIFQLEQTSICICLRRHLVMSHDSELVPCTFNC